MLNEVFKDQMTKWVTNPSCLRDDMKCELHDDARKDLNDDLFRFDHSKLHENFTDIATLVPYFSCFLSPETRPRLGNKGCCRGFFQFKMILSFSIINRKWVISVVIIPCVVTFMLFFYIQLYTFFRHFDGYDLIHFLDVPTSFV